MLRANLPKYTNPPFHFRSCSAIVALQVYKALDLAYGTEFEPLGDLFLLFFFTPAMFVRTAGFGCLDSVLCRDFFSSTFCICIYFSSERS